MRHVLARHEQGAGHMAEAYARVSGAPGVVLATSGPGAPNLVTPIANARMDSTPLVCVTGHVERGEPCFPMIPPGAAAVDMVEWPGRWSARTTDRSIG